MAGGSSAEHPSAENRSAEHPSAEHRPSQTGPTKQLADGWYLMSTAELERELARHRGEDLSPTIAPRLSTADALARRDAGNLPDAQGRTLRLILHVADDQELKDLSRRRLEFEPDFHDAPRWRGEGSVPVNVVPLRSTPLRDTEIHAVSGTPWWEEPDIAALEEEWSEHGTVGGVAVPGDYRSFVFKTVLSLRAAGKEITVDALAGSIARWVPPQEADRIRQALEAANPERR
jgi:hypothetical protein